MLVQNKLNLVESIPIALYRERYCSGGTERYAVLGNIMFPNCMYSEPLSLWDINRILNSYTMWKHDEGVVEFHWTGKGYSVFELEKDIFIAFNPDDNKVALRRKKWFKQYDFGGIKVASTYIIFKCDVSGKFYDLPPEIAEKYSNCQIETEA